jgi:hypothetical protein
MVRILVVNWWDRSGLAGPFLCLLAWGLVEVGFLMAECGSILCEPGW